MSRTAYARPYLPTLRLSLEALDAMTSPGSPMIRPGQWVSIDGGPRGQYLGRTARGDAFVIRWQQAPKWTGKPEELSDTRDLRAYARRFGSR